MISTIVRRIKPGLAMVSLVCLGLVLGGPTALAQESFLPSDRVIIDVVDAELNQVITMLSKQTSMQIIMATTPEEAKKKVTVHVDGQPIERVLRDVLMAAGVKYRKTEDGTFLIGGYEEPQAVQVAAPVYQSPAVAVAAQPVSQRRVRSEVVKLRHASAYDMVAMLTDAPPLFGGDNMGAANQSPLRPIGNVETPDYEQLGGVFISEPVPPVQDIHSYATGVINDAKRADGVSGTANQFTPGRPGGTTGTRTTPTARPGGTPTSTTTSNQGGGLLPEGIDFVRAYDIDNSVIVRGDDEGIAELKELIHMLDVPPKQVQIKAEFIEVSTNTANRLGIDWQLDRLNTSISTSGFAPSTGNVFLGVVRGNVLAQLRAELTSGKGRIVNSPIISTINNMWAEIQIGQEIPVFLSNLVSTGQGNFVSSTQLSIRPINSGLSVLPRINGDDSVTMFLRPMVSDQGRIFEGPDGQEVPEARNQYLTTNRRVMNGDTIVVGGFVRRSDSTTSKKVPLLGDLPIIGGLFTSKAREGEDRELLIFITPTIIEDSASSSTGVRPML